MRFFDMKENLRKIWDEKTDILFHANVCQIFIFDYLFRSCTYSRLKFQKTGQKVGPAHIFSYQEPTISSANNRKDFSEKRPQKRLENAFDILFSRWCMSVFLKRKKLQKPRAFGAFSMAPPVGLEPTTLRLTAACSTNWAKEEYFGDPCGNRTHVNGVRGRCLNRLTNGPQKPRVVALGQLLVHHQGLEPGTPWLRVRCSTNWANGAYTLKTE